MSSDPPGGDRWVSDPRFELNEIRRPAFTVLKKGGVDPEEVDAYATRLERLAKDFARFTRDLETRISHAKSEARAAQAAERRAVDEAMLAAFDAKERILLQAEEQAWEIEEGARRRAAALSAPGDTDVDEELVTLRTEVASFKAKIEDLEIQVEQWRKRASRLEADALRHADVASAAAEQSKEAGASATRADEVLRKAERRSQAMLAAARAEAARIASDAEEVSEQLRTELEVTRKQLTEARREAKDAAEPVGGTADDEEARRIVAEAAASAEKLRGDAQALHDEAARVLADAQTAAALMREEARAEADGIAGQARSAGIVAQTESVDRVTEAERSAEEILASVRADASVQAEEILAAARTEADRMTTSAEELAAVAVEEAERAAAVRARADAEAEQVLTAARLEADRMLEGVQQTDMVEAPSEGDRLLADARIESERIRAEAAGDAERARSEAAEKLAVARTKAERIHKDASDELTAARREAEQIRSAAARLVEEAEDVHTDAQRLRAEAIELHDVAIEPDEPSGRPDSNQSRYERRSAQLPRMGDSAGSVLHDIADLRKRTGTGGDPAGESE